MFEKCVYCGNPFLKIDDTDAICDTCSDKLLTGIHFDRTMTKNIFEDKEIKRQWQEYSTKSSKKLDKKCFGPNYIQDKSILEHKIRQHEVEKPVFNDPLLNRRFIIE